MNTGGAPEDSRPRWTSSPPRLGGALQPRSISGDDGSPTISSATPPHSPNQDAGDDGSPSRITVNFCSNLSPLFLLWSKLACMPLMSHVNEKRMIFFKPNCYSKLACVLEPNLFHIPLMSPFFSMCPV
jgi:hypothetical protein